MRRLASCVTVIASVAASSALAATDRVSAGSLSDLLKRQTEEFARASQSGDRATLARYLAADVVFTNETGASATRDEMLEGAPPAKGAPPQTVVVDWKLRPQGDVATATFTDVVTRSFFGHLVESRFRSTETWARRGDRWVMIASDTAYVPRDPAAVQLSPEQLSDYVGAYQLAPGLSVSITRVGDGLVSSTNGAQATPLAFEARDVGFLIGGGNGRRLFLRNASGRVEGYLSSRDGTDLRFNRIS